MQFRMVFSVRDEQLAIEIVCEIGNHIFEIRRQEG